jgi:hypothetical protein
LDARLARLADRRSGLLPARTGLMAASSHHGRDGDCVPTSSCNRTSDANPPCSAGKALVAQFAKPLTGDNPARRRLPSPPGQGVCSPRLQRPMNPTGVTPDPGMGLDGE